MTGRISVEAMRQRVDEGRDPHTGEKCPGVGPGLVPTVKPTEKTCKICGVEKPIGEFPTYDKMRDGHRNECNLCLSAIRRKREARRRKP